MFETIESPDPIQIPQKNVCCCLGGAWQKQLKEPALSTNKPTICPLVSRTRVAVNFYNIN